MVVMVFDKKELKKDGKPGIAPLNRLPLLPSGPGGFSRSWSYRFAAANVVENYSNGKGISK